MQRRAAIQILGTFKTSPTFGIEAIVDLIPINLYLQKLSGRLQLWAHSLPPSHIICSLMEPSPCLLSIQHLSSLGSLIRCQYGLIKGHLVDTDNRFNQVFLSFVSLHPRFSPSNRVIDIFSNHFSFNLFSKQKDDSLQMHIHQLDSLAIESSSVPSHTLVIIDASVKNNIATSISHMHIHNKPVIKTLYHVVHVTSTEANIFAIRCSISQATSHNEISKIIIITDSIYAARKIFDPTSHPYQVHAVSILIELHNFFLCHQENSIEFWECPSHCNQALHKVVDKETKSFNPIPLFPCKVSWDFSKKSKCNDIVNRWKITFQALDFKEKQFLDLLDSNDNIIELLYIKGRSWLKFFIHSNSLYTRASRAITNHTLIGKYRLRFFPRKEFKCPYGLYPIKTRHYILHEYQRFNKYWNPRRDSISHFIMFLESIQVCFLLQIPLLHQF